MATKLHGATIVGAGKNITMNEGIINGTNTLTITSDGYLSIASPTSGLSINADGGDLTLVASSTGDDIILSTGSTGEIAVRSTLKQYGTNGTITINNSSISATGAMTMTASNGIATMSGLSGCIVTGGVGDVTLSGNNIYMSGEVDTTSGGLAVKANNGSSDVTITAPIAVGRAGQPGLTATGGSSSADGITVTGGSTDGYGIVSTGSGTGAGIKSIASGTGYGMIVEAVGNPPTRSTLRLVPQDSDPSSSLVGDMYVRSASGLSSVRTAGDDWGRHVTKVRYGSSGIVTVPNSVVTTVIAHIIPANSVKVGSTVRVFASGQSTNVSGSPAAGIIFGGVTTIKFAPALTNATNAFIIDAHFTIGSLGSSGTYSAGIVVHGYNNGAATPYETEIARTAGTTINTTNGINVKITGFGVGADSALSVDQFIIDITD